MKTWSKRTFLAVLPLCLLVLLAAGCDEHDVSSGDITDVIYAVGDVVLAIIQSILGQG